MYIRYSMLFMTITDVIEIIRIFRVQNDECLTSYFTQIWEIWNQLVYDQILKNFFNFFAKNYENIIIFYVIVIFEKVIKKDLSDRCKFYKQIKIKKE